MTAKRRLVVYTVLTGTKEPLGQPLAALPAGAETDLEIRFVCFTDNPALRSDVWEMRLIEGVPLPAEKLSRRPKALPHDYLAEWDVSLYVDNIVVFKRLPQAADLATDGPVLFKAFRHATRSQVQQEADAIVQIGYERSERICAQLDHSARHFPLDTIGPLSTCTVLLREHHHPQVRAHGITWWEQILNFSKRDQMSFDFALKFTGTRLQHLPGLKHDNDLIHNTMNAQGQRVLANFDAVKYAWRHRDDAQARSDPRGHWLARRAAAATPAEAAALDGCTTESEWFDYLCHRQGSSLGSQVAPRRHLAGALQDLLAPRRGREGRLLLVRVVHTGATAYTADELERAEAVLTTYLGAGHAGTRIELSSAQLVPGKLAFRPSDGVYDVVLVIGLPGALLPQAHTLVTPALQPQGGVLCVLAADACALGDVARVEAQLADTLHAPCRATVQGSRHDGSREWLPNTLLGFAWQRPVPV